MKYLVVALLLLLAYTLIYSGVSKYANGAFASFFVGFTENA